MSAIQPIYRMRNEESRRAWLEGWLAAYEFMAQQIALGDTDDNLSDILAASFRNQLKEITDKDEK